MFPLQGIGLRIFCPAQGFTLPGCPELHSALWVCSTFRGMDYGDSALPRVTPCPAAQSYTLRYVYVPPSGECITEILPCPGFHPALLPRVTLCVMGMFPLQGIGLRRFCPAQGFTLPCCPGFHSALWVCSPFRGMDYGDSALPRVTPCPGCNLALWVCSPFRGMGYGDSAQGGTLRYGYVPPSGERIMGMYLSQFRFFGILQTLN